MDATSIDPISCLIPDMEYLFSARIKIDKPDGSDVGLPTQCKNSTDSSYCLHLGTKVGTSNSHIHRTKDRLYNYRAPNYGEWYDWTARVSWEEDELSPENPYFVFYIYNVEEGSHISLDSFEISAPSEASYPDPNDLCGELIINGDAEVIH